MRRLLTILALVIGASLGGPAGSVAPTAASTPVGGCPDDFQLISLKKLAPLLGLTLEQVQAIHGIDNNGDGFTCFSQSTSGNFHGTDNVL